MDKKIKYVLVLVGSLYAALMVNCRSKSEEPLPQLNDGISLSEVEKDSIVVAVVDSLVTDTVVIETKELVKAKVKPKKKYKPRKRVKKAPTVFPTVTYSEFFKSEDPREHGFVLDINGKRHVMRIGEVIGEMELVKGDAGSVTLFFKTERRRIAIKQ